MGMSAVLAFDIGTTHLKWLVADQSTGETVASGEEEAEATGAGPVSEQDPRHMAERVEAVAAHAALQHGVERVGFSAAMHSFVAVSAAGEPLTSSWTWLDRRAHDEAERAAALVSGSHAGHHLTAMSGPVRWRYCEPDLPSGARPVALKDYLVFRLSGQWLTDYSTASAGGWLGQDNQWSPAALALAGLDPSQLPTLCDMGFAVPERQGRFAVVVGANDAAVQHVHLNVGAGDPVGVLSMGTSGAVRVTADAPTADMRLFSYSMGPRRGFLVGAAFSNVGNLLAWVAALAGVAVDRAVAEGLEVLYREQDLPVLVPYLYGERTPWWQDSLTGMWRGLGPQHGRGELFAATLLAIGAVYHHGLQLVRRDGYTVSEVRGASGLLEHPGMASWMADALGVEVVLVGRQDASLLGAADLASGQSLPRREGAIRHPPEHERMTDRAAACWQEIERLVAASPR